MKNSFSKKEAVFYGWNIARKNFKFLALSILFYVALCTVPGFLADTFRKNGIPLLSFILNLSGWVIQMSAGLGLVTIALKIHDGQKSEYSDLFSKIHLFIPYLFGSVVYGVIVVVGYLLLIIPGLIWSIKLQYFSYLMVDKNMGPIDAMKESSRITKGHKWNLFLFGILLILINFAGLLAFGVGLFITVPVTFMANVYVYKNLSGKSRN